MKRYEIVQIHQEGVWAASSTPEMTDWIERNVKEEVPDCRADRQDPYHMRIEKLKNRDKEIAWIIISKLCSLGWEPFSVITRGEYNIPGNIFFRKEIDN